MGALTPIQHYRTTRPGSRTQRPSVQRDEPTGLHGPGPCNPEEVAQQLPISLMAMSCSPRTRLSTLKTLLTNCQQLMNEDKLLRLLQYFDFLRFSQWTN